MSLSLDDGCGLAAVLAFALHIVGVAFAVWSSRFRWLRWRWMTRRAGTTVVELSVHEEAEHDRPHDGGRAITTRGFTGHRPPPERIRAERYGGA